MKTRGQNEERMRNSIPNLSSTSLASNLGERRYQNTVIPSHTINSHPFQDSPQQTLPVRDSISDTNPNPHSAIATLSGATKSNYSQCLQTAATAISSARYQECMKNHGASMGIIVLDGCGEFMPSGLEGTLEALKCAACGCHRDFHRKGTEGELP